MIVCEWPRFQDIFLHTNSNLFWCYDNVRKESAQKWLSCNPVELKSGELNALILLISLINFTCISFVVVKKIFILLVPRFLVHKINLYGFSFPLTCTDNCWNNVCILTKSMHIYISIVLLCFKGFLMKEKKCPYKTKFSLTYVT